LSNLLLPRGLLVVPTGCPSHKLFTLLLHYSCTTLKLNPSRLNGFDLGFALSSPTLTCKPSGFHPNRSPHGLVQQRASCPTTAGAFVVLPTASGFGAPPCWSRFCTVRPKVAKVLFRPVQLSVFSEAFENRCDRRETTACWFAVVDLANAQQPCSSLAP